MHGLRKKWIRLRNLYGASKILLKRESFRVRETSQNECWEVWRASGYDRTLYSQEGYWNENGNTNQNYVGNNITFVGLSIVGVTNVGCRCWRDNHVIIFARIFIVTMQNIQTDCSVMITVWSCGVPRVAVYVCV
jgi:hypothetical protein